MHNDGPNTNRSRPSVIPIRTTLIYAFAGVLWIIVSDRVLSMFSPSPEAYEVMQTYKGWAFIAATSLLLYIVLRGQLWVLEQETARRQQAQEHVQRLNRVYAVLSGINQAIVRSLEPHAIFEQACKIAVEEGGFEMAWIGIVDEDKKELAIASSAGVTHGYLDQLDRSTSTSAGRPELEAFDSAAPAIVNSIKRYASMSTYRDRALQCGFLSLASFPLIIKGNARGTFNLYAPEEGFFDDEEIRLLRELALDIAFGVAFSEQESQRKQAEDELRQSEFRYHSLVENSPDAIFVDLDGHIVLANQSCMNLFGMTASQILTKYPIDLFHPDSRAEIADKRRQLLEFGRPLPPGEERIVRADGQVVDVEVVAAPFQFGGALAIHVILRDITERKKALASLRQIEERLRRAVSAGNIGLWDWDLRTNEVYYSPEWKRQIGCADDEIGNTLEEWQSRVHPDDIDAIYQAIQGALAHPRRSFACEFRFRHKDGSYRWILSHASVLADDADRPVRMLGSHVDVTDRKHLEDQVLQSQKMESVGRLAGGIAHDFNNLLSVIIGFTEMVLEDLDESTPVASDVREIRNAGIKAASLTRQLLTFSRRHVTQPEIIDLRKLVADNENMLRRIVGEDVHFTVVCDDCNSSVKADPSQLEQVLMNLVVNARDAMPDGGQLTVEVQPGDVDEATSHGILETVPGPFVVLAVTDTGLGMDAETMRKLFEPFFTTKGVGKGTGLGLATVYGIVRQSGGQIVVYSEPTKGSTFKIFLPRVDAEGREMRAVPSQAQVRGTETILLVEDESTLRAMTRRILAAAGYTILCASDALEALDTFDQSETHIDLVLTDVVMPGMSGPEMAARMLDVRSDLKILYMSGYADDAVVRHGVLTEKMQFIGKPFTAPQLTVKVRDVLDS